MAKEHTEALRSARATARHVAVVQFRYNSRAHLASEFTGIKKSAINSSKFWSHLENVDSIAAGSPVGYSDVRNRGCSEECRVKGAAPMISKGKPPFDPIAFLSKVNGGRAISDYRKNQIVYTPVSYTHLTLPTILRV